MEGDCVCVASCDAVAVRLLVELALRVRERDRGGGVRVVLALPMTAIAAEGVSDIDEVGAGSVAETEGDSDPVDDTDRLALEEGKVVLLREGPDDRVALNDGEAVADGVVVKKLVTDGVGGADIVALLDVVDACDSVSEGVPDIERVGNGDLVMVIDGLVDKLDVAD